MRERGGTASAAVHRGPCVHCGIRGTPDATNTDRTAHAAIRSTHHGPVTQQSRQSRQLSIEDTTHHPAHAPGDAWGRLVPPGQSGRQPRGRARQCCALPRKSPAGTKHGGCKPPRQLPCGPPAARPPLPLSLSVRAGTLTLFSQALIRHISVSKVGAYRIGAPRTKRPAMHASKHRQCQCHIGRRWLAVASTGVPGGPNIKHGTTRHHQHEPQQGRRRKGAPSGGTCTKSHLMLDTWATQPPAKQ